MLRAGDSIEPRRRARIKAKIIYRDPSRSSHSHVAKASRLRWQCRMLLVETAWARGTKALPTLPN
jgi:hypothetical protein